MRTGTYRALSDLTLRLYRGNGDTSPTLVETREIEAGETFAVPATVNGHYYAGGTTSEEREAILAEFGHAEPANVERIEGV